MRRRALLASAAPLSTLGVAGCLDNALSGARTVEADDTLAVDGFEFEVAELSLQVTFVEQGRPFWRWNALGNPRGQYAVVPLRVRGDDERAAVDALDETRVDTRFSGKVTSKEHHLNVGDQDEIRLATPVLDRPNAGGAAIVFADAGPTRYRLGPEEFDAFAAPPDLAVDVSVPDTADGNRIPVELEVWNRGDSPGTLAWTTTHSRIEDAWWTSRTTVPADDTKTVAHVHDSLDARNEDTVEVTVDYGLDRVERTVTVDGG